MTPSLFFQTSREEMVICCRPKPKVNINISCLTQLLYLVYWSALVFPFLFLCTEGGQVSRFTAFIYVSSPQHQSQWHNKNSYFFPFLCRGAKCKSRSSLPHSAQCLWIKYVNVEAWKCYWKGHMGPKSPACHSASTCTASRGRTLNFCPSSQLYPAPVGSTVTKEMQSLIPPCRSLTGIMLGKT